MTIIDFITFYFVVAAFVYLAMTAFILRHRQAFREERHVLALYTFLTALAWVIFLPYLILHRPTHRS